ncbi:N-acetylmuramoyl-L-alanine amidase family protein [Plantactinospora sp. WMMB782]|uniref:N-acetylmuramoyl-L-alanine amidase family protein n=1 Tax=Plantactinospora sp. WMMB782 TaxID=3404121 RepID=UPI003B93E92B
MSDAPLLRRRTLLAAVAGIATAPLLASPAQAAPPKIYLDPGHGGTDPGAVGNGLQEKALTLDIALRTRTVLQSNWDVSIRMSRTTDITRSLSYRSSDANSWGANIFVSIHINAGGGTGFESYVYPVTSTATLRLQDDVHAAVLSSARTVGSVTDRGQKTANFQVLRETAMSAVLTENLFIDRAADAALLARADFRQALAVGHARGIARYFGLA